MRNIVRCRLIFLVYIYIYICIYIYPMLLICIFKWGVGCMNGTNNQYYNQHVTGTLIGWMITTVYNMRVCVETGARIWIIESVGVHVDNDVGIRFGKWYRRGGRNIATDFHIGLVKYYYRCIQAGMCSPFNKLLKWTAIWCKFAVACAQMSRSLWNWIVPVSYDRYEQTWTQQEVLLPLNDVTAETRSERN